MKPKDKDYTALLKPVGTKQTAVDFLLEKQNSQMGMLLNSDFIQAKEMERQQKDDFAIEFYDWCNSIEGKYFIDDLKIVGELNKNPTTNQLLKIFKNK